MCCSVAMIVGDGSGFGRDVAEDSCQWFVWSTACTVLYGSGVFPLYRRPLKARYLLEDGPESRRSSV
jgi:hypothetical protein